MPTCWATSARGNSFALSPSGAGGFAGTAAGALVLTTGASATFACSSSGGKEVRSKSRRRGRSPEDLATSTNVFSLSFGRKDRGESCATRAASEEAVSSRTSILAISAAFQSSLSDSFLPLCNAFRSSSLLISKATLFIPSSNHASSRPAPTAGVTLDSTRMAFARPRPER